MIMAFKIYQLNCQHSRAVMLELTQTACLHKPDIILIQEPYICDGKVTHIPAGMKVCYTAADFVGSAIMVKDGLNCTHVTRLSTPNCTVIRITVLEKDLYFASAYFKYNEPTHIHLAQLERVLLGAGSSSIIIGADVNAKSPLWYSTHLDEKGEMVETFIAANQFNILNEPSELTTFESAAGSSNIDVTLVSRSLRTTDFTWRVTDWSVSDHRLLEVKYLKNKPDANAQEVVKHRFNFRAANWRQFDLTLTKEISNVAVEDSIDDRVDKLTAALHKACESSIPYLNPYEEKNIRWWTDELNLLKSQVRRARRQKQRSPTVENIQLHSNLRNEYVGKIRKAKREHFIREVSDANDNPWGRVIRKLRGKIDQASVIRGFQGETDHADDLPNTLSRLLETSFPADDDTDETVEQRRVRVEGLRNSTGNDANLVTEEELNRIIKDLPNGKAPGPDRLGYEIIKRSWGRIREIMAKLINDMLITGYYPKKWKIGEVKLLPKSSNTTASPTALRPLTLLSCLSKITEKVIVNRLDEWLEDNQILSLSQYGFKKGTSTEDALNSVILSTQNAVEKYVAGISLDIKGAFDNAWWPNIQVALVNGNCPANIKKLLDSYLQDREVSLNSGSVTASKILSKGCAQGSLLGPKMWNINMNSVFSIELEQSSELVGFADDLFLIVKANSARELSERLNENIQKLEQWASSVKLKFSVTKTQLILLKGSLQQIPPVYLYGQSIKRVKTLKYLGVMLQEGLKFDTHIKEVCSKALTAIQRLRGAIHRDWGLTFSTMLTIYKVVFVPIITYACGIWGHVITTAVNKRTVLSAQRTALIMVCQAYRTVSHDALHIISGVAPLDLVIQEKRDLFLIRRDDILEEIRPAPVIKEATLTRWQIRWNGAVTGAQTRKFFPSVKDRLKLKWFKTDFFTSQFLTGHGCFREYLKRFHLTEEDVCLHCGEIDTVTHATMECPILADGEMIQENVTSQVEWDRTRTKLRRILSARIQMNRQIIEED